jgi:hypothetical protein
MARLPLHRQAPLEEFADDEGFTALVREQLVRETQPARSVRPTRGASALVRNRPRLLGLKPLELPV